MSIRPFLKGNRIAVAMVVLQKQEPVKSFVFIYKHWVLPNGQRHYRGWEKDSILIS